MERIIPQASGDDAVFRAFAQILKDNVRLPADGVVIGEPVLVTAIEYKENVRRGLTASIRREDGSDHVVGLGEVMFSERVTGSSHCCLSQVARPGPVSFRRD